MKKTFDLCILEMTFLLFIILFYCSKNVFAQQWTIYAPPQGLAGEGVIDLETDQNGNIWAATENGVSRFNGAWQSWRKEDGWDNKIREVQQKILGQFELDYIRYCLKHRLEVVDKALRSASTIREEVKKSMTRRNKAKRHSASTIRSWAHSLSIASKMEMDALGFNKIDLSGSVTNNVNALIDTDIEPEPIDISPSEINESPPPGYDPF